MRNRAAKTTRLLIPAIAAVVGWSAPDARAVTKCSVTVKPQNGVIGVSAKGVSGNLLWGDRSGAETNPFANAATCIASGKATGCTLGATTPTITPEAITPPDQCTLYLKDDGAECAVHVKGCTPGLRVDDGLDPRFGSNTSLAVSGRENECVLGEVWLVAGSVAGAVPAAGQILPINTNQALFSLLFNTYGGDARTTFALPDLRAAAPNGLTYVICTNGIFPSRN
jgi:hypothetical protein